MFKYKRGRVSRVTIHKYKCICKNNESTDTVIFPSILNPQVRKLQLSQLFQYEKTCFKIENNYMLLTSPFKLHVVQIKIVKYIICVDMLKSSLNLIVEIMYVNEL